MSAGSVESESDGPWELPEGWTWTQLGAVLPIAYGRALPDRDRSGSGEYPVFGSSGAVGSHNEFIAPANSIMVGRKGSAGSVFLSETPAWPIDTAYFTSGCAAVEIRYGYWYLWFRKLGRLDQSTAIPSLSRDIYDVQPIPLAPLAEQKRIVARVDALFAEIAEGEAALGAAREGLDIFRRALLKAAVTGELTKDWRALRQAQGEGADGETGHDLLARIRAERATTNGQSNGRGRRAADAAPLDTSALPALPEGWAWGTLDEILVAIEAGLNVSALGRPPVDGETGIVKVSAVTWGEFDQEASKALPSSAEIDKRDLINVGDFLFSRANTLELVGAPVIVKSISKRLVLSDKILRFRLVAGTEHWLEIVLKSAFGRQQIESRATGAQLSMRNISQESIRAIPIPIPPPTEAAEILRRVSEALTAQADTLAMLDAEAADAARLKQAILKAAFEGHLVPQEPNDEPASAMLARLKATAPAATQAASQPKRGRGRKPASTDTNPVRRGQRKKPAPSTATSAKRRRGRKPKT